MRGAFIFLAAASALLAADPVSGRVVLGEKLAEWKKEIEASGAKVAIARVFVENGAYVLPPDAEAREVLMHFFGQYEFRAQFALAHALNVNIDQPQRLGLVILNMERLKSSQESEEAIVGHELGHIWLHQRGLRAPPLLPGALACEAIHTGDLVQHVLIRRELDRRGIEFKKAWTRDLENAYRTIAKQPVATAPAADICVRLQRLAQIVDLRLGLAEGDWENREKYESRLIGADVLLGELVTRMVRLLNALELENRIDYYAGLGAVRSSSTLLIQQLVEQARPPVLR